MEAVQKNQKTFTSDFHREVYEGLTHRPKYLSSKYFYDKKGDKLFQEIMKLPEYYLTRKEYEIFSESSLAEDLSAMDSEGLNIIELGAGDGYKTKVLLGKLLSAQNEIEYIPIDISRNALKILEKKFSNDLPHLSVNGIQGEYFKVLSKLASYKSRRKIILFLGSNIGNLSHKNALQFLKQLQESMQTGDMAIIGFDLVKDPDIILAAYNDQNGVTSAFNLNLLERINRELLANFDMASFKHLPFYDQKTYTCKSFLVSQKAQTVRIKELSMEVNFVEDERIHTEISQKYTHHRIQTICQEAGLDVVRYYTDKNEWFADYLLIKN